MIISYEKYQKKLEDFALKRQIKHTSTVMDLSVLIHTFVKLDDAEDVTNEKIRNVDLPQEINVVTSKLEPQNLSSEIFDPNLESIFTQTTDPKNRSKPQFQNYCNFCHKSNHSVSKCFRKQRENEEKN